MLATLTDAPFDNPEWVFEDKYDGFRMIAAATARSPFTAGTARSSVKVTWKSPRRSRAYEPTQ
jgi:ATP-dependent DNA ligase